MSYPISLNSLLKKQTLILYEAKASFLFAKKKIVCYNVYVKQKGENKYEIFNQKL